MIVEDPTDESLRAENSLLRQRIAELEAEQRRLSGLLQATIDHIDAVIYLRDADGTFLFVNDAHLEATALERGALIGKRDCDVFPQAVYEAFRVADRLLVATHQRVEEEEVLPRPDGAHTYRSVKFPVLDEDGALVAMGGISTDITAHKRAEAALGETRSLLRAIIENAPLALFATDRDGRFILVSREAARHLGRAAGELLGAAASDIMSADAAQRLQAHAERVFETGEPLVLQDTVEGEDGPRICLDTKFPIRASSGQVHAVCSVVTDVTDLRQAEEEQRRLNEELIEAQQIALQELSTPIIPIAAGALAMPLIGTIDRERMQQIVQALLHGIAEHRATIAILDVTGLRRVEPAILRGLIGGAQAARLLGAEVVLTGVQPQMARVLVNSDASLDQFTTLHTLQSGIEYVLRRLRRDPGRNL